MDGLRRMMSLPVVLMLCWIIFFAVNAMHPLSDPDTPWHIATGLYILSHHHVPTHDPFSWSMRGQPWVTQEWLFEVALAWLTKHFAFFGAWFFIVAVHTATVVTVYRTALWETKKNQVISAIVACLSTWVAWPYWVLRPQIMSYFFFALFLLLLVRARHGKRKSLWVIPLLLLIWANFHASVSIGVILLLLEVLLSFIPSIGRLEKLKLPPGERKQLVIISVLGVAFGFVNPNGVHEFTYALLSTNQLMVNSIMEWHSPDFHSAYYKYGVLPFLMVIFLLLLSRKKTIPMRDTLYFGGSFAMALIYQRFVPYLTIVAAPLLGYALADWGWWLQKANQTIRLLYGTLILCLCVYFGTTTSQLRGPLNRHWSSAAYPIAAVQYLKTHPYHGKLLNAYNWGGYLIYNHIPTFIDGRTDIFLRNQTFSNYMDLQNLAWNAPALLKSYDFSIALLPPGYALTVYLEHDPHWQVVFDEGNAEILKRVKA